MPSNQPTHHGYAVNVKDHAIYTAERGDLTDDQVQAVYEQVQVQFWDAAEFIAEEHGFENVYSEGRMGGWAVPYPQPDTDNIWPSELDTWLDDRFRPFEAELLALLADSRATFEHDLAEAVRLATAEPAERAYWAARDTITIDN